MASVSRRITGAAFSDWLACRLPFFYGYVMIPVAMMVQVCTSPGQTFAVSAFTPALRESLQMSDSKLSLAYMLGTFAAAFPLSLVGPLADRFGLRRVTAIAIFGLAATCLLASRIQGFASLLAVFLLLRFLGQGALTLLGGNAIAMWFRSKIGRVSAIMSIGTAVAFAWVPGWLNQSITALGWRQTFVTMAVIVAAVMLPMMWLLFRNRPEDMGQRVDGIARGLSLPRSGSPDAAIQIDEEVSWLLREAYRTIAFPILGLVNGIWAMTGTGIVFYLFTLCADRGMPDDLPPSLFKVFGLSMLAMQLGGGFLADFLKPNRLLGVGTCLLAGGMLSLATTKNQAGFYAFAALFGSGQGLLIAVNAVMWVRYYGREYLGSIRGTVWCLTVAGSGCGPLLMGVARDRTGSFDAAIITFATLVIPLAITSWFAVQPLRSNLSSNR